MIMSPEGFALESGNGFVRAIGASKTVEQDASIGEGPAQASAVKGLIRALDDRHPDAPASSRAAFNKAHLTDFSAYERGIHQMAIGGVPPAIQADHDARRAWMEARGMFDPIEDEPEVEAHPAPVPSPPAPQSGEEEGGSKPEPESVEEITEGLKKIIEAPRFDPTVTTPTWPDGGKPEDPPAYPGVMIDSRAMEMIAELAREIKAAKEADESYPGLRIRVHKAAIQWNHYLMMKLTDTLTEQQQQDFQRDDKLSRQTDAAWASAVNYLETHDE